MSQPVAAGDSSKEPNRTDPSAAPEPRTLGPQPWRAPQQLELFGADQLELVLGNPDA